MDWLQALILGIIQGLTEYLPVSSSGHLAIGANLFGMSGEENLTFTVAVHVATVLSTVVILWKEIVWIFADIFKWKWNEGMKYAVNILISMIPVAIVGLLFKDKVEAIFGSGLLVVGICLMITASLLAFSYWAKPRQRENISPFHAFVIGIAQALAVLPGLSRSGSTIATGLLLGNKKEKAMAGLSPVALAIGFIAAFVSGCLACKWMINIVKKGKLIWFAAYCVVAGIFAIILNYTL